MHNIQKMVALHSMGNMQKMVVLHSMGNMQKMVVLHSMGNMPKMVNLQSMGNMQQFACLVLNPLWAYSFGFLFNFIFELRHVISNNVAF